MKSKEKQFIIYMERELHKRAADLAWKRRVSLSALIRELLEAALKGDL